MVVGGGGGGGDRVESFEVVVGVEAGALLI